MSFQDGLSGLTAASRNLDVIGNNVANANTTGMKAGRAEFSELIASAVGIAGGANDGIGVSVDTISQSFSQGNISVTGNDLDVAINGSGFFQTTTPNGTTAYTRAGNFKVDASGNLVTNNGSKVLGYAVDPLTGTPTTRTLTPMSVPTGAGIAGKQTSSVTAQVNLNSATAVAASVTPPTPLKTFGTSVNVFDGQGTAIPVSLYFTKTAANTWDVFGDVNGTTTATPIATLTFDNTGKLATAPTVTPLDVPLPDGTGTFPVTPDLSQMTQFSSAFATTNLTQDGYSAGQLVSVKIGTDGMINTTYSNGKSLASGKLALANFRNVQGLSPIAGGSWTETFASGPPVPGEPAAGNFGQLKSGALEDSNVDLTAELVAMMSAQRSYQANAQTIKTQDQVLSTVVNLR